MIAAWKSTLMVFAWALATLAMQVFELGSAAIYRPAQDRMQQIVASTSPSAADSLFDTEDESRALTATHSLSTAAVWEWCNLPDRFFAVQSTPPSAESWKGDGACEFSALLNRGPPPA